MMRFLIWARGRRVNKQGNFVDETFEGPFPSLTLAGEYLPIVRKTPYISSARVFIESLEEAEERLHGNQQSGRITSLEEEQNTRGLRMMSVSPCEVWSASDFVQVTAKFWAELKSNHSSIDPPVFTTNISCNNEALKAKMAEVALLANGEEPGCHDGCSFSQRKEAAQKILKVYEGGNF